MVKFCELSTYESKSMLTVDVWSMWNVWSFRALAPDLRSRQSRLFTKPYDFYTKLHENFINFQNAREIDHNNRHVSHWWVSHLNWTPWWKIWTASRLVKTKFCTYVGNTTYWDQLCTKSWEMPSNSTTSSPVVPYLWSTSVVWWQQWQIILASSLKIH